MNNIQIGNKTISYSSPVYIVAEGCDNHLGDISKAKEMIFLAKQAGADAIKFQHHLPDEEMLPEVPLSSNFDIPLYDFLKEYALTLEQHIELKKCCEKIGIQYLCTPFSYKAALELNDIGVEAFKIGSGEMTDIPTLEKIAQFSKPMIVSTGMSTFAEIDRTYVALCEQNVPLILMNCVSEYPPCYEDINVSVVKEMISRYPQAVIGHSDHTPDIYTCFAAVALGARVIEKHVILDKSQPGPDNSVSIDFSDLTMLVDGIRKIDVALGSEKRVHGKEEDIRRWAFRSLVVTCDISRGDKITSEMVWSKRPGTGIPSYLRDKVIGRYAARDIKNNTLLSWDDIEGGN
ncbi:MAG: N-acetylneuraminate synthase family protein [Candidatus Omnitrophica bacterium]|nr:N-acetylneuraminate synthase family protein [Candidatus Omnitrophota bacterium]